MKLDLTEVFTTLFIAALAFSITMGFIYAIGGFNK